MANVPKNSNPMARPAFSAAAWLAKHDPKARARKRLAKLKRLDDKRQAERNPALTQAYRDAIFRRR